MQAVAHLAARRERKTDSIVRTDGMKIHALLLKIHARDAHDLPVLHSVLHGKQSREKA